MLVKKFGQNQVSKSWDIAGIEFVLGGLGVQSHILVKPNFCFVKLSWVLVELRYRQYLIQRLLSTPHFAYLVGCSWKVIYPWWVRGWMWLGYVEITKPASIAGASAEQGLAICLTKLKCSILSISKFSRKSLLRIFRNFQNTFIHNRGLAI